MHKANVRFDLEKASAEVNSTPEGSEENRLAKQNYDNLQQEEIELDAIGTLGGS